MKKLTKKPILLRVIREQVDDDLGDLTGTMTRSQHAAFAISSDARAVLRVATGARCAGSTGPETPDDCHRNRARVRGSA